MVHQESSVHRLPRVVGLEPLKEWGDRWPAPWPPPAPTCPASPHLGVAVSGLRHSQPPALSGAGCLEQRRRPPAWGESAHSVMIAMLRLFGAYSSTALIILSIDGSLVMKSLPSRVLMDTVRLCVWKTLVTWPDFSSSTTRSHRTLSARGLIEVRSLAQDVRRSSVSIRGSAFFMHLVPVSDAWDRDPAILSTLATCRIVGCLPSRSSETGFRNLRM